MRYDNVVSALNLTEAGPYTPTMKPSGEKSSRPSGRRGIAALALVLVAGLLLRGAYLFSIWHAPDFASPVLDPQLNDYWARAIVTGNWSPPAHADDPEIATTPYGRPPGYPYFLAVVYRVLGLNYGAPRLVQTALGLINLLLLYFLGKAWFGRGAGLAAAGLGAVFWSFLYFEGELNSPVLEVFLYLTMSGALWKWFTSRRWDWALLAGVLLGLHALVRPNVLLPGVFAAAWMVWAAWNSKASVKHGMAHAAVFLLAAAMVISPALVRNYRVAHEFVLISYYGGINAYIGNNPGSTGDSPKIADLREITGRGEWNCFNYPQVVRGLAEKQGLPDASFSGASRWFYRRALDFWVSDPLAALALTARKAALFWGPAEVSDSKVVSIERLHSPLLRWLPGFPAMLALALLWTAFALARHGEPTAPGAPRFGLWEGVTLSLAVVATLAGLPVPVMVAIMWVVITCGWLRNAGYIPVSNADLDSGALPPSPPTCGRPWSSKGDLGESCLKSPFEGGFRGMFGVSLALTLILAHFLSVLPFFIAGRYRLPVAPFLILLGGDALAQLSRWATTPGQRRHALVGAIAAVALFGAVGTPIVADTQSLLPRLSTWHYHRGVALADAGKPGPAVLEFRQAVQADQKNGPAWLRLGFACAATGDAAGALEAYTNAAIASPDNPLAHNNLGWELQKAGRTGNARKEFERALELDPGLEIAAINLGNLLIAGGERNKAVAVYEQLLLKNPKATRARKNLEALKEQISPSNNRANKQAQE